MRRLLLVLALLLGAHQALAADGFIQVPPDSTGKQIDSSAVSLRPTDVTPVYRQRYNVCDNAAPDCAPVSLLSGLRVSQGGSWAVTSVPEQLQRPLVGVLDPLGMVRRSVVIGDGGSSYAAVVKSGVLVDARQPSLAVSISPNGNAVVASGSVSVTNFPGTQPVSGTVAVSNFPATQVVSGTGSFTVTGTVTTTPPSNASTNVTQFGSSAVVTGTGVGGAGIPRVTVSSDSFPVTQAVSGTVTDNQGTANSAANGWPVKVTDGTNVGAVKAASTAAAATDPSTVAQLSPNQPQLTTPLNVQGGKTNNNAAPGATNLGTLDSLANAAPPTWTEGDQVALSQDLTGNVRVYSHPPAVLGCYQVNTRTPTYTGLAIAAPLFSMRWGDATHIAIIERVQIFVVTTGTATTVGLTERELVIARSFTVSDTGGTAIVLTTNNNKMRTSQGTSLVTNMQVGGPLTAGTRTLDVNAVASVAGWSPLTTVGVVIGSAGAVAGSGFVDLFNAANGQQYPIVLATNEGIVVRIGKDAMPAGATQQTYVNVNWCEASSY